MYDLVIVVMACDTIPKYRDQILKIEETYGKLIRSMPNVKILYFLGEDRVLEGEQFIHCKGVLNNYDSVTVKQFWGLRYVSEYIQTKYVMCIGSDTYLNIKKLLKFLEQFDPEENLYIGGHGAIIPIEGVNYYYHGGGPGFVLSKKCLDTIYPQIKNIDKAIDGWARLSKEGTGRDDLFGACDLWMGYVAAKESKIVKTNGFFFCNFIGFPCHLQQFGPDEIISCHCMSLQDFDIFTKILEAYNYFI